MADFARPAIPNNTASALHEGSVFLAIGALPGLRPEMFRPALNQHLDYVVFTTTATASVSNRGEYSLLPLFGELKERDVPVFLLPDLNSASRNPSGQSHLDLAEPYETQRLAVEAGARILLKDFSMAEEVFSQLQTSFRDGYRGEALADAVCDALNTPEFNEQQRAIRERKRAD
jgi:hypothetical protein